MLIPDDIRKCVAFIGTEVNGVNKAIGSVFFVGKVDKEGELNAIYAVTARHNIDAIRNSNRTKVMVRLNDLSGGNTWIWSDAAGWFSNPRDPSIDVAIHQFNIPANYDHLVFPMELFLTEEIIKENEIGLGDEVVISGLFKYHFGDKRNIPIVRTGNIAGFHEEKIPTKNFGLMDAHLIECRSISGLSGSPVFVNIGMIRRVNDLPKIMNGKPPLYLGLAE